MSTVTDLNTLFGFITGIAWTGRNSSSQGTQDLTGQFTVQSTYFSTAQTVAFATTNPVTLGFNTYYKMQGFNTNTGKYEVWHSMGTPLLVPPSGNTLSNIEIIYSWIDR